MKPRPPETENGRRIQRPSDIEIGEIIILEEDLMIVGREGSVTIKCGTQMTRVPVNPEDQALSPYVTTVLQFGHSTLTLVAWPDRTQRAGGLLVS